MDISNTTININGDGKVFKYVIEALPSDNVWVNDNQQFEYIRHANNIHILNSDISYVRYSSNWGNKAEYIENMSAYDTTLCGYSKIPEYVKTIKVRIYFPAFSPDVYNPATKYMLTINTWLNGYYIDLGSYVISRVDTLAVDHEKKFNDDRYFEYYEFEIADPKAIMLDDEWDAFRKTVCHNVDNNEVILGNESIINFVLHPVEYSNNTYIQDKHYYGGQNSINISNVEDYFRLNISKEFNENGFGIKYDVGFKSYYDDIDNFLNQHYKISNPTYEYRVVAIDKNNYNSECFSTVVKNNHSGVFDKYELSDYVNYGQSEHFNLFDSWNNWRPGIVFIAVLSIKHDGLESPIVILSNEIPITQDIFKYLLIDNEYDVTYINLDELTEMKQYNISAVNKIINKVIQVDKPNDSKANIIQPIFFKSQDINNIIIHPEVTENICINLDRYKSKVNNFILRIEGVHFKQISSITQGIVFKIIGNSYLIRKLREYSIYLMMTMS